MCISSGKLAISRKWREIRTRLLLIIDKKCHTPCQMGWKALILDDFEDRCTLLWLNDARWGLGCY